MNGSRLKRVKSHKVLGLIFNSDMTWEAHIRDRCVKATKRINLLKLVPLPVPRTTKLQIYISFIRPLLEYASVVFDNCSDAMSDLIEDDQRQAALSISGAYAHTRHVTLLTDLRLNSLKNRRRVAKLTLFYKIKMFNWLAPNYLRELIPLRDVIHQTRNADRIDPPIAHKNYYIKSFIPSNIRSWNTLDSSIKNSVSLNIFKTKIKRIFTPNQLYRPHLTGHSRGHIQLTRLRLGLSGLNAHRKSYHFINFSSCPTCNNRNENTSHFLLSCPTYAAPRAVMIAAVSGLVPDASRWYRNLTRANSNSLTNLLIRGTLTIPAIDNHIFKYVADYITCTRRFR